VVVVAPESAIRAALIDAAADTRLSSLAPRLRAAADALGLAEHEPQRFEAVMIDAAGGPAYAPPAGAGAGAAAPAPAAAPAAAEPGALARPRHALGGAGLAAHARVWTGHVRALRGHLPADGLGGRAGEARRYAPLEAPHRGKVPVAA
jgi:hypothetical protein